MGEAEHTALFYFKHHLSGRENDPSLEEKFAAAIRKSRSAQTINLGILLAVEAGWHRASGELFSVDLSAFRPILSDYLCHHPLHKQALSLLATPLAGHSRGRQYTGSALLHAIATKRADIVGILAKHMDLNVNDIHGRPLLHYVYSLRQQDVKEKILDIVLPKLKPSIANLRMASEHADPESARYIAGRLGTRDRCHVVRAGMVAILNGHDDTARWIVETPGVID